MAATPQSLAAKTAALAATSKESSSPSSLSRKLPLSQSSPFLMATYQHRILIYTTCYNVLDGYVEEKLCTVTSLFALGLE
jgi:hypothetical protein